jgi:peptidoglycan/LPS O-acetylase OafA/YrhL
MLGVGARVRGDAPVSWRVSGGAPDPDRAGWDLRHISALDGIRGLAVVAVLFFHGNVLVGGYLGVDAFFVLSGFLITSLLLTEVRRTHRVDFAAFWTRRAKRLLPALFVLLIGVAVFALFVATSSELGRIRSDALATLGYVANWHSISQNNGYWSLFQAPSPLEHTWSLAIEEQFYLVWPLVVFAIAWFGGRRTARGVGSPGRFTARSVLVLCVVLVAASAGWMAALVEPGQDPSRAYFGTDTRAASILVGAALAALLALRGPVRSFGARVALEVAGLIAFVGLGVAWATVGGQSTGLYRGGFLLCGLGVATVIAAGTHPLPGPLSRVLSIRPICAIGLISYGLYLWHWPIYLVLTEARTGLDGWALLSLRITLSVAVATVSFFVVERPIRRGSISGRKMLVATPAVALVCIVAVVVTTVGATTPSSGPNFLVSSARHDLARVEPGLVTAASRLPPQPGPRVLVVGDSVAGAIGESAEFLQAALGVQARSATVPGCLLEEGVGARALIHEQVKPLDPGQPCLPTWIDGEQHFVPNNIVIIYGSAAGFEELELGGTWAGPCDGIYRDWYESQFRAVLSRFAKAGTTVNVVRLPHLVNDWAPPDTNQRIDCVNTMNELVARTTSGVRILDLATFVCPQGQCRQEIDGVDYRVDGMHFSTGAAKEIARWLTDQISTEPADGVLGRAA